MTNHTAKLARPSNTKGIFSPLALFLVLAAGVSAIEAQDAMTAPANPTAPADASALPHGDRKFIRKVARASTNEVALSMLADSRSSSPDVKSFAQMMVTDHTQANTDLGALAKTKGIDISKSVDEGKLDGVSDLSITSGAVFDKAYAKLMVSAHNGAVDLFKDEVASGKDPDVVAFARKYLDTLTMHLDHALALEKKVNP
jgi:putative membrane protein